MLSAMPVAQLLLAIAPVVLLLAVGATPFMRKRLHRAISSTALAMGLALLVLQLFLIGVHSLAFLHGFVDSELMLFGLPLATFFIALGFLCHRSGLSLLVAASCGVVGTIGLWYLGGVVAIRTVCGLFPSGGC